MGAGAGVCVCTGGRRRRGLRFFGFLRFLTGALGGRTADGEMPPVAPAGACEADGACGAVPPVLAEGGAVPPVAADALAVPHASATRTTRIAHAERTGFPPCMGVGIGPPRTAF